MVLIVGVVFAIVSFIFCMVSSASGGGQSCEITGGNADCPVSGGGGQLSFFTLAPNMLAVALIGFGLSGEIFMRLADMSLWVSLIPAVIIGYGLMFFVNNYIYLPLQRTDNSAKSISSFVGLTVEVTENIRGDGFGSIRSNTGEGAFNYTARSHDGSDILAGEQANILAVEDNNCMVVEKIS
jgi:membrane protein implicated in regulation of membrane protease activity